MRTVLRLAIKQSRFELAVFAIGLLGISLTALALMAYAATPEVARCLAAPGNQSCAPLQETLTWLGGAYQGLAIAGTPLAVLAGALLGIPLVGRELESGTAPMAWTLATSRLAWLLPRFVVWTGLVLALSACVGVALDLYFGQLTPQVPLGDSLGGYEQRGWLVPARALLAFVTGVLAGAVVGRALPAVIVAALAGGILLAAPIAIADRLNRAEAQPQPEAPGQLAFGLLMHDRMTGENLEPFEAFERIPFEDPRFGERFEPWQLAIPGTSSRVVVLREVAIHLVEFAALSGALVLVVQRRRPYLS